MANAPRKHATKPDESYNEWVARKNATPRVQVVGGEEFVPAESTAVVKAKPKPVPAVNGALTESAPSKTPKAMPSRALSIARQRIEEAMLWTNFHIAGRKDASQEQKTIAMQNVNGLAVELLKRIKQL